MTVSGILSSFSEKVHEFLALNKLISLQLPTRKLNFQVLHKSLVITNMIIGAVTVGTGRGWRTDLTVMRKYSSSGRPSQTYRHGVDARTCIHIHVHNVTHSPNTHQRHPTHLFTERCTFSGRGSYYPE